MSSEILAVHHLEVRKSGLGGAERARGAAVSPGRGGPGKKPDGTSSSRATAGDGGPPRPPRRLPKTLSPHKYNKLYYWYATSAR